MSQFLTRLALKVASDIDDGQWILTAPLISMSEVLAQ